MLFPSVVLTAGFGAQGASGGADGVGVVPQINGPIWSFGPRAYWSLLDFGRLDAVINIEEMQTHEALVRYKKTIIGAVEDVDQAIVQYDLNLQRWKALGEAQHEIHRAVVITQERYRSGETDLPPSLISSVGTTPLRTARPWRRKTPCLGTSHFTRHWGVAGSCTTNCLRFRQRSRPSPRPSSA